MASPYARRLAKEGGVSISQAQATGPGGRIVAADVQKLISSGGGKQPSEEAEAGAPQQVRCHYKNASERAGDLCWVTNLECLVMSRIAPSGGQAADQATAMNVT